MFYLNLASIDSNLLGNKNFIGDPTYWTRHHRRYRSSQSHPPPKSRPPWASCESHRSSGAFESWPPTNSLNRKQLHPCCNQFPLAPLKGNFVKAPGTRSRRSNCSATHLKKNMLSQQITDLPNSRCLPRCEGKSADPPTVLQPLFHLPSICPRLASLLLDPTSRPGNLKMSYSKLSPKILEKWTKIINKTQAPWKFFPSTMILTYRY